MTTFPYSEVFKKFEDGLIAYGSNRKAEAGLRKNLDRFKNFSNRTITNHEYFKRIVLVAFFSGFKADTVNKKANVILKHFPCWEVTAQYDDEAARKVLADPQMIRNKRKVTACINNAKRFKLLIDEYGSIQKYIDSYSPNDSFENLILLKESLEDAFEYLGGITVYHFMTDIGLNVLKPDRVLTRIFFRLGLIKNTNQLLATVIQGRKFAEATNVPIRYVDIIFVTYGQSRFDKYGIDKGICLQEDPQCNECQVTSVHCNFRNKSMRPSVGSPTMKEDIEWIVQSD